MTYREEQLLQSLDRIVHALAIAGYSADDYGGDHASICIDKLRKQRDDLRAHCTETSAIWSEKIATLDAALFARNNDVERIAKERNEAVAILRDVAAHEIKHRDTGKWCNLVAMEESPECTCGQWELTARIESFVARFPRVTP